MSTRAEERRASEEGSTAAPQLAAALTNKGIQKPLNGACRGFKGLCQWGGKSEESCMKEAVDLLAAQPRLTPSPCEPLLALALGPRLPEWLCHCRVPWLQVTAAGEQPAIIPLTMLCEKV